MACHRMGQFPCGKCPGCLEKRSSDWSVRLVHENQSHDESSFITLTFEDDSVVDVSKEVASLFMKRLRKRLEPKRIRYYLVSEYGEKGHRPHYHAIIFGHDFRKDEGSKPVRSGLYTSPILEAAWGLGHVSSGSVSDASIRYVTNYILGKDDVPEVLDLETGVSRKRAPVFALMSRKPGIGADWIERHMGETFRDDNVVVNGFTRKPPRYYENRVFRFDDESVKVLRSRRRSDRLKKLEKKPEEWLRQNHPDRRVANVKIWKSRQSLKRGKEI